MKGPSDLEWHRMSKKERGYYVQGLHQGLEMAASGILGDAAGKVFMDAMKKKILAKYS